MGYAEKIRPVSYLKANAAAMLRTIADDAAPVIITQNGEAKAVLQDLASFERYAEPPWRTNQTAVGESKLCHGVRI